MRSRDVQQRKRRDLAWCLLGFALVQAALAVGIEWYWPAVRDPEYTELEQIVRQRQAEAPGRPLVLVLGSSCTKWGLRAEYLNGDGQSHAGEEPSPLVLNWGVDGSGPMFQQVFLRRALAAGLRPDLVFLEVLPMTLSAGDGVAVEEKGRCGPERLTAIEAAHVLASYAPQLGLRWVGARLLPINHNRAELRDALALDVRDGSPSGFVSGRDRYGWIPAPASHSPQDIERLTQEAVERYRPALTQPAVAPTARGALRDVLQLCREEQIDVVLVIPPLGSSFRSCAPAAADCHVQAVRSLASEAGIPVIDAREWLADDAFFDGHHVRAKGADQYTRRFAREALACHLPRSREHHEIGGVDAQAAASPRKAAGRLTAFRN